MAAPALTQYANGIGSLTGDALNTMQQTCDTFAQLRAFPGTTGLQVYARGGAAISDGLQGVFYWSSTSIAADDSTNVLAPNGYSGSAGRWLRSPIALPGYAQVYVEDYGATGNGITDDTASIQTAINAVSAMGGGVVNFGGAGRTYLLAGPFTNFGTFTKYDSTVIPFARGILQLLSNVSLVGRGCTLLMSGGRSYPGSIFFNQWWTTTNPLANVRVTGLVLDCNAANQTPIVYPANTSDGYVWEFNCCFILDYVYNLEIDHCVLRNSAFGHGALIGNDESTGGVAAGLFSRQIRIHDNEFYNLFATGMQIMCIGLWVYDNYFHGNGYWVAAIDYEIGIATDFNLDAWFLNNLFDFRDGLSPTESTPQFASNSSQAIAAQVHTRRWLSLGLFYAGFPGNVYNGATGRVTVSGNHVWQGTMDGYNYPFVQVIENIITNIFEDISAQALTEAHAIHFSYSGSAAVTGLTGLWVNDNYIDSALNGYGIYITDFVLAHSTGNMIANSLWGGIRYDLSGGLIGDNDIENVGVIGSGFAVTMGETGGGITAIIASGGSGYIVAPIVTLTGGGGTGGAVVATVTDGVVTSLTVTPGTGYTSAPTAAVTQAPQYQQYASGVVMFGSQGTTLDVLSNRLRDTRTGSAQQMTYAIYANVSASPLVRIQNNTGANMITGIVDDVNGSTFQVGNTDGVTLGWATNAPVSLPAGLTTTIASVVTTGTNDAVLTIQSPTTQARKISFLDGSGLEYIIAQSTGNSVVFQQFLDGVFQRNDLGFTTAGEMQLNVASYGNYANDAAAAAAGVIVGGIYRNGSVLQMRVS